MDAAVFRKELLEDVIAEASVSGEGASASFVKTCARYLEEARYINDFNEAYFEGAGKHNRKLRVDGYAFDELDYTMTLCIADYNASEDQKVLTKTQAKQLSDKAANFVIEAQNSSLHRNIEISRPASDLASFLKENKDEIVRYRLLIFTTASISSAITKLDSMEISGVAYDCEIWGIERLFNFCGISEGRQIVEVDFRRDSDQGIRCIVSHTAPNECFKSYLFLIPGDQLADIYDQYGSALLERNVRSFLTAIVAVNKKIRQTIKQEPETFLTQNNGISATAMGVLAESTQSGLNIKFARDFQIINGCQTTAMLSYARYKDKADLSLIEVAVKLTVIDSDIGEERASELIQKIARSSNSQSKINDADFSSTAPFHIDMERSSKALFARATSGSQVDTRWLYERSRGHYLQEQDRMTPAEKKKFQLQNPKAQLVTKTDLAKARNAWEGLPHEVSCGANTNFTKFEKEISAVWANKSGDLAYSNRYYQESVALRMLFIFTEQMITDQEWYQSSYRANIVAYAIAILHKKTIESFKGRDLDLIGIWDRQFIPEPVLKALTDLSLLVYQKITDTSRKIENVTQWCKKEECWLAVQTIEYTMPDGFENCLAN